MTITTPLSTLPVAFAALLEEFRSNTEEAGFTFTLASEPDEPSACTRMGHKVTYTHEDKQGVTTVTFSYLKETELQAAQAPDLSIGARYNPARHARHSGQPTPAVFDAVCRALQRNYFRVGAEYETNEDQERSLMVRGNWHPQAVDLVQGVLADIRYKRN